MRIRRLVLEEANQIATSNYALVRASPGKQITAAAQAMVSAIVRASLEKVVPPTDAFLAEATATDLVQLGRFVRSRAASGNALEVAQTFPI